MHQNNADLAVLLRVRKTRVDRASTLLMAAEKNLRIAEKLQAAEKAKVEDAQAKVRLWQSERQSFTNKYVAGSELKKRNELLLLAKAEWEDVCVRHLETLRDLDQAQSEYEKYLAVFKRQQKIFVKTEIILEEITSESELSQN